MPNMWLMSAELCDIKRLHILRSPAASDSDGVRFIRVRDVNFYAIIYIPIREDPIC